MKNILLIIVALTFCFSSYGQPNNDLIGDVAMPAPNAAALGKYGDIPISKYTGVPNIAIPIHNVSEGPLSLPISLNYHSSGIRVGETASWVGLGWSLNAGGVITRTVLGKPDDQLEGYYDIGLDVNNNPNSYYTALLNGPMNQDLEADIFSFNVGGYSGKFIIDANHEPVFFPKQDLVLQYEVPETNYYTGFTQFTLITPDGTKYHFGKTPGETLPPGATNFNGIESTLPGDHIESFGHYNTSWYLVQVESADGNYTIDLEYEEQNYSYKNLGSCSIDKIFYDFYCCLPPYGATYTGSDGGPSCQGKLDETIDVFMNTMRVKGKSISTITTSTETIQFNSDTDRLDLDIFDPSTVYTKAEQLDNITIETGGYCTKWIFDYDYFQSDQHSNYSFSKRLKLNQVHREGCDQGPEEPPYVFTYEDEALLPSRMSKAIDHWGFYNGASQNQENFVNVPTTTIEGITEGESVRESNGDFQQAGILKKIQYPTGGTTSFTFESNTHPTYPDVIYEIITELDHSGYCPPNQPNPVEQTVTMSGEEIENGFFKLRLDFIGQDPGDGFPPCGVLNANILVEVFEENNSSAIYEHELESSNVTLEPESYLEEIYLLSILGDFDPDASYTFKVTAFNAIGTFDLWAEINELVNREVGGLRIKEIRSSTANTPQTNDIIKTYEYKNEDNPLESSGTLYQEPKYAHIEESSAYFYCQFLDASISPLGNFDGYHIGYDHVVELHNGNGSNEYFFEKIEEPQVHTLPALPTLFTKESGHLHQQKTFSESGNELSNIETSLTDHPHVDVTALGIKYHVKPVTIVGGQVHLIYINQYTPRTAPKMTAQQISTKDNVTTTTTYEYDQLERHQFPTALEFSNSDGKVHRTDNRYIYNYQFNTTIKNFMIDNNIISQPYQSVKRVDGTIVGGSQTKYRFFSGFPKAEEFYAWEVDLSDGSAGSWVLKGTVDSYDASSGNPHQFTIPGWGQETYTWQNGLISSREFEDFTWSYNYHAGTKFLSSITDIDGQVSNYEYDQLFRLQSSNQRNNAVSTTYNYNFASPNEVSQVTTFADETPTQSTVQQLDGLGRSIASLINGVVKSQSIYDNQGRVEQQTYLPGVFKTINYEPSPLNRPIGQLFPDGSETSLAYGSSGQYFTQMITDENGNTTTARTDIIGQQTMTRNALSGVTSNIYDDKGNLIQVTAPDGSMYLYNYDARNRLTSKTIPAGGTQNFQYNDRDLLVASQDANMADDEWLVSNYDIYGRSIRTGFFTGDLPSDLDNITIPANKLLSQTYYDEYSNLPQEFPTLQGCESGNILLGKVVGTSVNVLNNDEQGSDWINTINCIDEFGRVSKSKANHLLGGHDTYTFTLDLADNPTDITRNHGTVSTNYTIIEQYVYDNFFRQEEYWHQVNIGDDTGPNIKISAQGYNDKDQLLYKRLYGAGSPTPLQTINYDYNNRGWLTHINDVSENGDDQLIPDCDIEVPEDCGRTCDYTITITGDSFEESYPITGIYVKGNLLMDLEYPIYAPFTSLKNEIEQWLWDNGYEFESVSLRGRHDEYTLVIKQSNIVFNRVRQTNSSGFGFETFFEQSNCGVVLEPPSTVCELCIRRGYTCDDCPYWKVEEPCTTCSNLDIVDCANCEYAEDICTRCEHLGYADCASCPLTVGKIKPLKIQVEYNHSLLSGSNPNTLLVRVSDQSYAYQHDGTVRLREHQNMVVVGQGALTHAGTNNYPNIMEINLENEWVNQGTFDQVLMNTESLIIDELNNAGITNQTVQNNFAEAVLTQVAAAWTGTTDEGVPDQGYASNPDLFSMELFYNQGHPMLSSPVQRNGNIAGMVWKTGFGSVNSYSFEYDALNRLTAGLFRDDLGGGNYAIDNKYGVSMTYDAVGNIQTLSRRGVDDICTVDPAPPVYEFTQIDNLTYTYSNSQLESISETSNPERGFKGPGGTYTYDSNGNMTGDQNKQLTASYNHLNLPYTITLDDNNMINFTYDASGTKLKKEVNGTDDEGNEVNYTQYYISGMEYKGDVLEAVYHQEGRAVLQVPEDEPSTPRFTYEYYLKDHLGNIRAVFSDLNNSGYLEPFAFNPDWPIPGGTQNYEPNELLQENHYYPFGMEMEGPWDLKVSTPENQYNYNGKEMQGDFNLDWLDYGARMYDPSIGRWNAVDPMASKYASLTPYNYVGNNPLGFIDPDGRDFVNLHTQKVADARDDLADAQASLDAANIAWTAWQGRSKKGLSKEEKSQRKEAKKNQKRAEKTRDRAQTTLNTEIENELVVNDILVEFQRANPGEYNRWDNFQLRGIDVDVHVSAQDSPIPMLDAMGAPTGRNTTESVNWVVRGGNPQPVTLRLRKSQVGDNPRNVNAIRANTSDLVHGLGHIDGVLIGNNTEDHANDYERNQYANRR